MRNKYYKLKDNLLVEVTPAKAMIYTDKIGDPKILYRNAYKGYEYIIVSYGTHPCCYIGLDEHHKYYAVDYDDIDLDVHGGLTYSGTLRHVIDNIADKWYIGWDYAHYGDRTGNDHHFKHIPIGYSLDHTWKTRELIKECVDAIDKLEVLCNG